MCESIIIIIHQLQAVQCSIFIDELLPSAIQPSGYRSIWQSFLLRARPYSLFTLWKKKRKEKKIHHIIEHCTRNIRMMDNRIAATADTQTRKWPIDKPTEYKRKTFSFPWPATSLFFIVEWSNDMNVMYSYERSYIYVAYAHITVKTIEPKDPQCECTTLHCMIVAHCVVVVANTQMVMVNYWAFYCRLKHILCYDRFSVLWFVCICYIRGDRRRLAIFAYVKVNIFFSMNNIHADETGE